MNLRVVDQYSDPTFAVLIPLLDGRSALEDMIKHADVRPEEREALPSTAFAWPDRRVFPIHCKEAAVFSRLYRETLPAVPVEVDLAIKQALEVYGVDEALFSRPKTAAPVESVDHYLLPDQKLLPVRSAEEVKTAEEKLLAGYSRLTVPNRALACGRLVEKAAQFKVKLNPNMLKLAGFTMSSTRMLRDWLGARVEATTDPAVKTAFQKLADGLGPRDREVRDRKALVKLADTIHVLDKKANLERLYDRKLPDPLMTVFNTEKVAGPGVDLGGRFVSTSRLAGYPSSFYADVLGDDLVREASDGRGGVDGDKLAMILQTLPIDMKSVLARQMGV